jgi:tetratricopeptide (TPR) repeat protein
MRTAFLSSEHWQRIADALHSGRQTDAMAEFAWLSGWGTLEQAMLELAGRSGARRLLERSEAQLQEATIRAPAMADGWLALYILESLKPRSDRERHGTLLEALALCADRLGEQQAALGKELVAFYVPLLTTRVRIATPTDARLLYVGYLTAKRELEAAERWLDLCDFALTQAVAASGYLHLHRGDFSEASDLFQQLTEDELFRCEGQLGAGVALAGLGLWDEAAETIEGALDDAPSGQVGVDARYILAGVLSHVDPELERHELEQIFAINPEFSDVAERLGRRRPSAATFEQIVAAFESGILAEEPEQLLDDEHEF